MKLSPDIDVAGDNTPRPTSQGNLSTTARPVRSSIPAEYATLADIVAALEVRTRKYENKQDHSLGFVIR
jgi:hypothetical protein